MNCTGLQDLLAKYVSDHQCNWDEHLPVWWRWPIVPVHMHPGSALRFIFCLSMRYDCQLMLCLDHNETTSGKCQTMWETCLTPLKKCISMPESTFQAAQKRQQDHHYQRITGKQIEVGDQVFLYHPARKKGQTKKLHSPWQGPYIVMTRIGKLTHRIQAVHNPRKRKLVHFNHLKLCGAP